MGWFQHGSTIIVFAPDGFTLCDNVREGDNDPHGPAADAAAVTDGWQVALPRMFYTGPCSGREQPMPRLRSYAFAALALAIAGLCSVPCRAADDYPSRLIKVILPFPPGSTLDALARVMTDQMAQKWGQPVVIENITGGGGKSAPIGSHARRPTATP